MAKRDTARKRSAPAARRKGPRPGQPKGRGKPGRGKKSKKPRGGMGETLKTIVIVLVVFVVFRFFLIQTFVIDSGSMERTLLVGDFVVANRAAMGTRIPFTQVRIPGYGDPRREDVLVFDPPHDDTLTLVKRLIGMPGDTLEMRDKLLYLNGELRNEPYVVHTSGRDGGDPGMMWQQQVLLGGPRDDYWPTRDNWGPLVIPPDRYFMLGDNRDTSLDGRVWGLLERWRFEGRVMAIYFSYNRDSMRPFPWIREIRWSRVFDRVR